MRLIPSSILYISFALLLSSCEFKCSVGDQGTEPKKTKTVSSSTVEKDGAIITNGVDITTKGVKIEKVGLFLPDDSRLSDDNLVSLGEKIKMVILIDSGWVVEDGKSFIGASEKISNNLGEVAVKAEDIFSDYTESGIEAADAKAISLSAVITDIGNGGADHYVVEFRIWDKKGTAEISGSYKFYLKK